VSPKNIAVYEYRQGDYRRTGIGFDFAAALDTIATTSFILSYNLSLSIGDLWNTELFIEHQAVLVDGQRTMEFGRGAMRLCD
jgi:hypothetical protein|tara:strand:- start:323 stop:568 length:246 start_codon:yes stop_codon:yes gene_type:complete